MTRLQLVLAAALALLLVVWVSSGSFVLALLVLVLVAGTIGLGVLVVSWAGRPTGPAAGHEQVVEALPTTDLARAQPAERVRRAVRGLLSRPWVHGDGLVRAATRRLASEDAMVWTPRGQRVAAPHLWVEWHPDDLAGVAGRWPLEVLADELLGGYLEHARATGARCLQGRTFLHLLASPDVPVGRVVVTAAFSRPQRDPVATATAPAEPAAPRGLPPVPAPLAAPPRPAPRPAPAGRPGSPARDRVVASVRGWMQTVRTRVPDAVPNRPTRVTSPVSVPTRRDPRG